jgi:hypothetical protein
VARRRKNEGNSQFFCSEEKDAFSGLNGIFSAQACDACIYVFVYVFMYVCTLSQLPGLSCGVYVYVCKCMQMCACILRLFAMINAVGILVVEQQL